MEAWLHRATGREQGSCQQHLPGLLPHSPSGLSSALPDCCCFVIRVNRPLQLGPHEIGRLHETGQVWNAVSLSLLLWKNPNYQNLAAKMNKKTRWMPKHVCVGRAKILKDGRTDIKNIMQPRNPGYGFGQFSQGSCCHTIEIFNLCRVPKPYFKPVHQVHVSCFLLTDTRGPRRFPLGQFKTEGSWNVSADFPCVSSD